MEEVANNRSRVTKGFIATCRCYGVEDVSPWKIPVDRWRKKAIIYREPERRTSIIEEKYLQEKRERERERKCRLSRVRLECPSTRRIFFGLESIVRQCLFRSLNTSLSSLSRSGTIKLFSEDQIWGVQFPSNWKLDTVSLSSRRKTLTFWTYEYFFPSLFLCLLSHLFAFFCCVHF